MPRREQRVGQIVLTDARGDADVVARKAGHERMRRLVETAAAEIIAEILGDLDRERELRRFRQTLREAERILVPEGHLILTGFNPISAWGIKQTLTKDETYPWHGHFFTLSRIKDWLALLGLEFVSGSMNCYEPPINDEKWLQRFAFTDKMGDKWWPMMGGQYFIVAKKRVVNITLLKPNWKNPSLKSRLVPSSNPKSKPSQQKTHKKRT